MLFLLRLQEWGVCKEEDQLVRIGVKNRKFSVKALFKDLEPRRKLIFPASVIWKSWVVENRCFVYYREK